MPTVAGKIVIEAGLWARASALPVPTIPVTPSALNGKRAFTAPSLIFIRWAFPEAMSDIPHKTFFMGSFVSIWPRSVPFLVISWWSLVRWLGLLCTI